MGEFSSTLPTGRKNPTDIKDIFDFKMPTGNGEFGLNLYLQLRKIYYPISYRIYGQYNYSFGGSKRFTSTDTEEISFRSGSQLRVGGRGDILLNDWISLLNEINYTYTGKGEIENVPPYELDPTWDISYEGGLVFQIRQFRFAETVRVPLKGVNTSADPLYILLFQYLF